MSKRQRVPVGATMVECRVGIANTQAHPTIQGQRVNVALWRDYCSQGYKSGYERVETLFLRLEIGDRRADVYRYTGNRLSVAKIEFDNVVKCIDNPNL